MYAGEQNQEMLRTDCPISKMSVVIGHLAKEAMLDEVRTTPKPGLVDCYSNGAHADMNLQTFENSAEAITPYIMRMSELGAYSVKLNADTFAELRIIGKEAEKAMFLATDGVNTHKGMIFSIGILAAAAGYCISHGYLFTENTLLFLEQKLVKETLQKELQELNLKRGKEGNQTNGERLFSAYGIRGIRGEAITGYESVRKIALPVFREGIKSGCEYNCVKLQTLFALMRRVQDSNVAARKGQEALHLVHECADTFLRRGGAYREAAMGELREMDAMFIKENISPGGCADLLAVTIFIQNLLEYFS